MTVNASRFVMGYEPRGSPRTREIKGLQIGIGGRPAPSRAEVGWIWIPRYPGESNEGYARRKAAMMQALRDRVAADVPPTVRVEV